jgi:uncharacterized protein (DUF2235 family)
MSVPIFVSPCHAAATPASPKRIVLCLDGTWNSGFEEHRRRDGHTVLKPTNPLKICRAVPPLDPSGRVQLAYYDIGVGALAEYPGTSNRMLRFLDRFLGGAWGAGFEGNVEDSLNFLVLNYEPGDEVFIFGFSRGAAQARAVAHFLDWSGGLPPKDDAYYLPLLFRRYVILHGGGSIEKEIAKINEDRSRESRPRPPINPFRPVPIKYLGVWDTVMALGSRFESIHDRTSTAARSFYVQPMPPAGVEHARQALAVDEQRFDFRPEIWAEQRPGRRMEQRWFPGAHSNVGGAYGNDGLANIALHWVKEGAVEQGLVVDDGFLKPYRPFFGDTLYDSYKPMYRLLDRIRFRAKRGQRRLDLPAAANATVDRSVIQRLLSGPGTLAKNEDGTNAKLYRPRNVIDLLALQPDLDGYVSSLGITQPIPGDVRELVEKARSRIDGRRSAGQTAGARP